MQLINFLLDVLAVVLMIRLFSVLRKQPVQEEIVNKTFIYLIRVVIAIGIIDVVWDFMIINGKRAEQGSSNIQLLTGIGNNLLALMFGVAAVYLTTVFLAFWLYCLNWRLYHDMGYLKRRFWIDALPLTIAGIALIISCILLAVSDGAGLYFTIAYLIFMAARLYYFVLSFWHLYQFKKQNGYLRFFNVWAFFLPVFAGWLLQDLQIISLCALGSAAGVYFLYTSIEAERRYQDKETGFYNLSFTDYLKDLISKDRYETYSAMVFDVGSDGKMEAFSGILKKSLPKDCEPIRRSDTEIVVLTGVKNRGPLQMVLDDVSEFTASEGKIVLRKNDESASEFMERVL